MTTVIAMPATSPASKPADSAFVPLMSIVDLINAAAERNQIAKVDRALRRSISNPGGEAAF